MASTSRHLTNLLLIVSLLGAKLQEIIEQPNDVRVCVGENATFTCTVNGQQREDITSVVWEIMNMNGDFVSVANRDCHILTKTMNSNGDLTENLTIVNVTMSDNGVQYRCNPIDNHLFSNNVSLIVAAPPDTVTNLTIPLDLITSTSFVAHWSEPSSDVVCGTYVVTVSTGGIIVIRNVTISRTTYNATGLCENTKYRIIVTVLNERGNSLSASMEVTTTNAVPTETKLTIISVQPLTSTSFTFNWVPSDPNYNYTVIWTNLHTGVMYNRTVPGNTNSYIVTGLSDDVNYNVSVAAVNRCGMMTSDPVTAYDPPNKPEISYCISYNNGQPLLQLFAYVMVDVPRMSLMLQFLTSYQTGTPKVMDANCSDIQNNIQYNCTAELTVDIIPSVEIIQSVNVTVRGPYGSNCSVMEVEERANAIVSVESFTTQDNATLICELACLSTGIQCVLFNITPTRNVGNITGSLTSYNPPTEQITLNNLISGRAYNFCVIAINMTDMMEVGHPVCDSFSTMNGSDIAVDGEGGSNIGLIIGLVIGALLLFVGGVILVVAVVYHNIKQRRNRNNPKDCDNLNSKASSLGVKNYSNQSSNDSENSTTHLVKRQCSIQSSSSSQQSSNEEDIDDETDEAVSTTQVNHNIYREKQ
ncbi:uncharacterized protein [Dysidea avara]|uniref:uncharacterized protein isoform X3 n=1 Tax=Dysidea avara TaxID=196820 RepID=UPI00332BF908